MSASQTAWDSVLKPSALSCHEQLSGAVRSVRAYEEELKCENSGGKERVTASEAEPPVLRRIDKRGQAIARCNLGLLCNRSSHYH